MELGPCYSHLLECVRYSACSCLLADRLMIIYFCGLYSTFLCNTWDGNKYAERKCKTRKFSRKESSWCRLPLYGSGNWEYRKEFVGRKTAGNGLIPLYMLIMSIILIQLHGIV